MLKNLTNILCKPFSTPIEDCCYALQADLKQEGTDQVEPNFTRVNDLLKQASRDPSSIDSNIDVLDKLITTAEVVQYRYNQSLIQHVRNSCGLNEQMPPSEHLKTVVDAWRQKALSASQQQMNRAQQESKFGNLQQVTHLYQQAALIRQKVFGADSRVGLEPYRQLLCVYLRDGCLHSVMQLLQHDWSIVNTIDANDIDILESAAQLECAPLSLTPWLGEQNSPKSSQSKYMLIYDGIKDSCNAIQVALLLLARLKVAFELSALNLSSELDRCERLRQRLLKLSKTFGKVKQTLEQTLEKQYWMRKLGRPTLAADAAADQAIAKVLDVAYGMDTSVMSMSSEVRCKWTPRLALLPEAVRLAAQPKIAELANASAENRYLVELWLTTVMDYPWGKMVVSPSSEEAKTVIAQARQRMEEVVYGQSTAKEAIAQFIASRIQNSNDVAPVLGFGGPPGTGKTTLAETGLAAALGLPVKVISLNGAEHAAGLFGLNKVFVGASPGAIVRSIVEAGCENLVLVFDELDKIQNSPQGEAILAKLMWLTDRTRRQNFEDDFLGGIKFDCSKILIVFTYNDIDKIPASFRSRICHIAFESFNQKDKKTIAKQFLLPNAIRRAGYQLKDMCFQPEVLDMLVDKVAIEAGVRELDNEISVLLRKITLARLENGIQLPVNVGYDEHGVLGLQ